MADTPKRPQQPDPETPEPEVGPTERSRSFLEERFTPLKKKSDITQTPAPPRPLPERVPETADEPPKDRGGPSGRRRITPAEEAETPVPVPPDFRRRVIKQYRERQKRQQSRAPGPLAPEGELVPPAPPVAPPANNWVPIGPSCVRRGQGGVMPATSGRTPGIAVAPGGNRAYIGAANGGVWGTLDGGVNWRPLMDAFDVNPTQPGADSLACGAVALVAGAAAAQDRLYVGSGEGAGGAYFGIGPLLLTQAATGWVVTIETVAPGSPELAGSAFYALAVDPADPERVVAVTREGLYRREPDGGGGFHWDRKPVPGAGSTWMTSVVAARSGGVTTFYAASWFGPVFTSTDGHTWSTLGSGFPTDRVGRISLAVRPDDPSIVYALIALSGTPPAGGAQSGHLRGVFRLDTGDGVWREVTGVPSTLFGPDLTGRPGQGSYDNAIAVAPDNANRIYLGGSTVFSGGDWSGSLYRCDVTVSGTGVNASPTYIGNSVHADIHAIVFTPGNPAQMWVGCDGGVFRTGNATGTGDIFTSPNKDLQTLTMNYLGQHPSEDAVLFCGTQDNGGERFTGEEAWLYSSGGDGGYFVVNWSDPYRVLSTYVRGSINRSITGGRRYQYSSVDVPLTTGEAVLFYAPIAGTPPNPGAPAEANLVAFGSIRPWISTAFASSWQSIPNGTLAADSLNERIKSLVFASATKLYAGTMTGGVYRFDRSGASWTRTRLDTLGGANQLPLSGVVTAITVDPADGSGNSIYIAFGGNGDYRHVWRFDGSQWQQRSGPSAGDPDSLLDVQHNAIVVDPANPMQLYVGADIGVWFSPDAGATWQVSADGLPDAAVIDLKLHGPRRLLRASTHGRGVFEWTLGSAPKPSVELYIRDTQLDQGRFTTINFLPDPTDQAEIVRHWRGPDIKLDTPDVNGDYQFPLAGSIDFLAFVDRLDDDSRQVATHATATITTRVYVQVHNRGVAPADNVRVMCLLANASAGLPPLPAGHDVNVQNGTPVNTADWQTIGIAMLDDVRVGFPKIAAFDLTSGKLPPPANLAGNDHHCVLALSHHQDDPYVSVITSTDPNSLQRRKAAHKNLKVVQFTGTLPAPPPVVVPFRIHCPWLDRRVVADLSIVLASYRGRARLFIPKLEAEVDIRETAEGWFVGDDFDAFRTWSEKHASLIRENQQSEHRFNELWSEQRLGDMAAALEPGFMFEAGGRSEASLRRLILRPERYHTLFLMLDRPPHGRIGETFELEIVQRELEEGRTTGGLSLRIELQPEPREEPVGGEVEAIAVA